MRASLVAALATACSASPAPPPRVAPAPFALPDRQLAESALALDVASGPLVVVPPRGPVELGGAETPLGQLAGRLARTSPPGDAWRAPAPVGADGASALGANPGTYDGTVLVRVSAVRDRAIAVVERDVAMLRLLEVLRAAEPIGLALAVADRAHPGPRVFAFRAADPADADPPPIDDPVRATIDRHRIHLEGPVDPPRDVPLGSEPEALGAAVAAVAGAAPRWAFVRLVGGSAPVSTAVAVVEALGTAGVGGVSFEAGVLGAPSVALGEPVVERGEVDPRVVRRYLRQLAFDTCSTGTGTAELALEVATDGTPSAVRVAVTGLDAAVEPCLTQLVAGAHLWSGKPAAITVTLDFEPDGGTPRRGHGWH